MPPAQDEISRLAETLNEMLARLEAAFEHERRFVADASHELRTPLALLRTELELALRRPRSPAELEEALRSAAEETERLSRLAEDLLLIARADQGALPVRREPIPAAEVLARRSRRASPRVRGSSAGRCAIEDDRRAARRRPGARRAGAREPRRQRARPRRGPRRALRRRRDDVVELHVADDGPGFPPDFVARAFDRFSRADEARGRGGTGLGLAIVELIAQAHGDRGGRGQSPRRRRRRLARRAAATRRPAAEPVRAPAPVSRV